MTSTYLTNITPDSLSGLIFAFEGIHNTTVLLNGPSGCKFYHSATSENQFLRKSVFDPLNYPEMWFYGQPRVPCTYLDKRDYVYGSKDKLLEALDYLQEHMPPQFLVIINTPGAALIGDDLERITAEKITKFPFLIVETPGYSRHVWNGYEKACLKLLERLLPAAASSDRKTTKKSVNLLGLSIFQKYYEGDLAEWKRLLALAGMEVNCALCCDCTLDEIQHLGDANLNLVIDPAYGQKTAEYLQSLYGTPYISLPGVPIGFSVCEELIRQAARICGCDTGTFDREAEKARARSYLFLSHLDAVSGLPKGATFAVHGTASQCLGYARFLIQYFGMTAECIHVTDPDSTTADYAELQALLSRSAMAEALQKPILDTKAGIVFADGSILAQLKALHHIFNGIEIGLPSIGYTDVIPKTHQGLNGSLMICEQIINGLIF